MQPPEQELAQESGLDTALIAFGANLPSKRHSPAQAVMAGMTLLSDLTGQPVMRSRLFRTPAFPKGAGPDFVNAAAGLPWPGPADDLLGILHAVEEAFGRTRSTRWEARIMDLDLIALGETILPDAATQAAWAALPPHRASVETPDDLILPHPRMDERDFVLIPLADIAPDWRHPLTGRSVRDMVEALPKTARDEIWPLDLDPKAVSEGD